MAAAVPSLLGRLGAEIAAGAGAAACVGAGAAGFAAGAGAGTGAITAGLAPSNVGMGIGAIFALGAGSTAAAFGVAALWAAAGAGGSGGTMPALRTGGGGGNMPELAAGGGGGGGAVPAPGRGAGFTGTAACGGGGGGGGGAIGVAACGAAAGAGAGAGVAATAGLPGGRTHWPPTAIKFISHMRRGPRTSMLQGAVPRRPQTGRKQVPLRSNKLVSQLGMRCSTLQALAPSVPHAGWTHLFCNTSCTKLASQGWGTGSLSTKSKPMRCTTVQAPWPCMPHRGRTQRPPPSTRFWSQLGMRSVSVQARSPSRPQSSAQAGVPTKAGTSNRQSKRNATQQRFQCCKSLELGSTEWERTG